jgi:membrane protease YdiL (CAAX protease family)
MSGIVAWATAATATNAAGGAEPVSRYFIAFLAVGLWVLIVWGTVRTVRPRKLLLRRVPGRPNRLSLVVVAGIYAVFLLATTLLLQATAAMVGKGGGEVPMPWSLPAIIVGQLAWGGASLALAAGAFRHGLGRGLGLSGRHWVYDSIRAVVGCLAVLPLCYGTLQVTRWLIHVGRLPIPVRLHPILEFLPSCPPGWKVVIVLTTVVLTPVVEEVFFRGLVQSLCKRYLPNPWAAVALASAVFAAAHGEQYQDMPALWVLGLGLGYNYERTGRLLAPILLHALFNAIMILARLTQ